jgi:hypothetical protein
MATITLEVPEELAIRLRPLRDRLPELLAQLVDSESAEKKFTLSGTVMTHPVFLELIEFLFGECVLGRRNSNWQGNNCSASYKRLRASA